MILEDKAIYLPEDDELKRANLVRIMADSILSRCSSSHGPVTFGVLGAWGEGKTSFMRMVQTSLGANVETVWFDPWNISDEDRIVFDFFSLLASKVYDKSVGMAIRSYGRAFLAQGDMRLRSPALSDSIERLAKCIPVHPQDFAAVKKEISKRLKDHEKHLVVFIDDIDRLVENEVLAVFRLVRQIADFDNVFYVMGFDPEIVSTILSNQIDQKKESGRTYLNKIIQVPIILPPVNESILQRLLSKYLRKLAIENEIKVNDEDIELISRRVIPTLNTKRDLIRYCNQLGLVLPAIRSETEFLDLCLSEFIKYLNEQGWLEIYKNKNTLLGRGDGFDSPKKNAVFEDCIHSISQHFVSQQQVVIEGILRDMFPPPFSPQAATRSVNNAVYFAQYFIGGVPEEIIPYEGVLALRRLTESVNLEGIVRWINTELEMYSHDEIDRSARTVLSLIQKDGKSTEKSTMTLCRGLALSALAENYSFDSVRNPNRIDLAITGVLIPRYLGRWEGGYYRVNGKYVASVLRDIFRQSPLNFAMNVLQGVYAKDGVAPENEWAVFSVLKNRLLEEGLLYPFKYSYVLQESFFVTWKRLDKNSFSVYMQRVLESSTFDAGKLVVDWMNAAGSDESRRLPSVRVLSDLFGVVKDMFIMKVLSSRYRKYEAVLFFAAHSPLFKDVKIEE